MHGSIQFRPTSSSIIHSSPAPCHTKIPCRRNGFFTIHIWCNLDCNGTKFNRKCALSGDWPALSDILQPPTMAVSQLRDHFPWLLIWAFIFKVEVGKKNTYNSSYSSYPANKINLKIWFPINQWSLRSNTLLLCAAPKFVIIMSVDREVDPALGRGRERGGDLSLTNCSIRFRSIMGTYLKLFYNGHYCGGGAGAGCGVWSWCWCWCQSTETLIVFSKQSVTRWRESPSLPALETIILGILLYCLEVGELFALSQSEGWDVSRQGLDQWIRQLLQMWTVVML